MLGYNTHTDEELKAMLQTMGLQSKEDLFSQIPKSLRLQRPLDLPAPMEEWELEKHILDLAKRNQTTKTHSCFLGGGFYDHYIPSIIDAIVLRGEFLTSYTPYQPEMSQGLLQALYEYQLLVSKITGQAVVNSSCYDGATALSEAAWTCCLIKGGNKKLMMSDAVFSHYSDVIGTYAKGRDLDIQSYATDPQTGAIDLAKLEQAFESHQPAGFLFQSPNAFGVLEDVEGIAEVCKKKGVVSVLSMNPILSSLFDPPSTVDIVTAEGQPLGIPLNAGGPSLGIFATRKEYRKYVPGRLVGKVSDINGNLAYALVFEDREQHVAREKATSNICSNQALNAIRSAIYLSFMGENGFARVGGLSVSKAHALCEKLCAIEGVSLARSGDYFNEFTLRVTRPLAPVLSRMHEDGIFAGRDVSELSTTGEHLLSIAVTEVKSAQEIEAMVKSFEKAMSHE